MRTFGEIVVEIIDRSTTSAPVDLATYIEKYPQHAAKLSKFFGSMKLINSALDVGAPLGPPMAFARRSIGATSGEDLAGRGAQPMPSEEDLLPGYRIEREIHFGAQGDVYRALQISTGRGVAVKFLRSMSTEALEWFDREVKLLAVLRHPNIVTLHDAGVVRSRPYCVMEFVDGLPLDRYLAGHTLSTEAKLRLFLGICGGVMHAHHYGVIHRDLKPSNVLVDSSGEPRIVDFGLAKYSRPADSMKGPDDVQERGFVGTFAYAAPEQLEWEAPRLVNVGSDVYSLGVVLYLMLTGRRPYEAGKDRDATLDIVRSSTIAPPSIHDRTINTDIDRIVLKALRIDPADRYVSAGRMKDEVEQVLSCRPIDQKRGRPGYVLSKFLLRNRRRVGFGVVTALLLTALGIAVDVVFQNLEETKATTDRRFELARMTTLGMLNDFSKTVANENRFFETRSMTWDAKEAHLARYASAPLDPGDIFAKFVEGMPDGLLQAATDPASALHQAAVAWIDSVETPLDELADTLDHSAFRFAVSDQPSRGLGWDSVPLGAPARTCEALAARAYIRRAREQHEQAVADIKSVVRLASDMADGVLPIQNTYSLRCRSLGYAFLQRALTDEIGNNEVVDIYARCAIADPAITPRAHSMIPSYLSITDLMSVAVASGSPEEEEHLDIAALDEFLGGYLTSVGALTEENYARVSRLPVQQIPDTIERFVMPARDWGDRTTVEILETVENLKRMAMEERSANPILWLIEPPEEPYLMRHRVRSRRQAVRLAAFAIKHRQSTGAWPTLLSDAVPPIERHELTDPRTGEEFEYDIEEGLPRIRSASTDDLFTMPTISPEWIRAGEDLVTYFPAAPHAPRR